jgi:phosphatidylinositol 3-kinase
LRINARLIVNMFYLMIHCGINELSENPENVLNKLHEKFMPNANPQEASNSLLNKLEESASALYPQLMEKLHSWAVYMK